MRAAIFVFWMICRSAEWKERSKSPKLRGWYLIPGQQTARSPAQQGRPKTSFLSSSRVPSVCAAGCCIFLIFLICYEADWARSRWEEERMHDSYHGLVLHMSIAKMTEKKLKAAKMQKDSRKENFIQYTFRENT